MTKKLYIVSVRYEYAVFAESPHEARRWKSDALNDESEPAIEATLAVTPGQEPLRPRGWSDDCLVYGFNDKDVRLDEALASETIRVKNEAQNE